MKRHGKYKTGYLAAILTTAIFGLTPVAISFGLSIYDYYFAAVFISYASATVIYTLTAFRLRIIVSMIIVVIGGVLVSISA